MLSFLGNKLPLLKILRCWEIFSSLRTWESPEPSWDNFASGGLSYCYNCCLFCKYSSVGGERIFCPRWPSAEKYLWWFVLRKLPIIFRWLREAAGFVVPIIGAISYLYGCCSGIYNGLSASLIWGSDDKVLKFLLWWPNFFSLLVSPW